VPSLQLSTRLSAGISDAAEGDRPMTQQALQEGGVNRRKARGLYRPAPEQQALHQRIEELRGRCVPVSEIAVRLYLGQSTVRRHLARLCNCLNGNGARDAAAEPSGGDRV